MSMGQRRTLDPDVTMVITVHVTTPFLRHFYLEGYSS